MGAPDGQLLAWALRQLGAGGKDDGTTLGLRGELADVERGHEGGRRSNSKLLRNFLRFMRRGDIDFIAYPVKDLPLEIPHGLLLAAVLPREDARDALVLREGVGPAASLAELPEGAVVCAPSRRRSLQIQAKFPHLHVETKTPSLQTRLRRLHEGEFDACVAAAAGLWRWGFREEAAELRPLPEAELMPAFGQGAVGLLCDPKDTDVVKFLAEKDDPVTRSCIESERLIRGDLELMGEAAVGGIARFQPDGQLHLQCRLATPGGESVNVATMERVGSPEDSGVMARELAQELNLWHMDTALATAQKDSRATAMRRRDATRPNLSLSVELGDQNDRQRLNTTFLPPPWERWDSSSSDVDPNSQVFPPILGASERLSADRPASGGFAHRVGRVCAVLPETGGALVDVNCEAPAHWQPEIADTGPSLTFGSEVDVYCAGHSHELVALTRPPPPLVGRGGNGQCLRLSDLVPGEGPFRAVVVSCTASGTLVDFNCEVPGRFAGDQVHRVGEELLVYCYEADLGQRTCSVGTEPFWERAPRMRLDELDATGATPYRGVVQRIWGRRAIVDFNCEVQGCLGPLDVDREAWPDGLVAGSQVEVYIQSISSKDCRARLSMFPSAGRKLGAAAERCEIEGAC